jgi:hypothetical protein
MKPKFAATTTMLPTRPAAALMLTAGRGRPGQWMGPSVTVSSARAGSETAPD